MAWSNAKPHVPKVFQEIMKNHTRRDEIRARGAEMTQAEWRELGGLVKDMKTSLRPSAELALRWNTDKGNVG